MPLTAPCVVAQPGPAIRVGPPIRAVRVPPTSAVLSSSLSSSSCSQQPHSLPLPLAGAVVRPLVRSAGCAQLDGKSAHSLFCSYSSSSSSSLSSSSSHYRVYSSDEEDSSDECGLRGAAASSSSSSSSSLTWSSAALSHLPSYSSVYSTLRQAANDSAQRQRDRQLEMTHRSAAWEQHKRAEAPADTDHTVAAAAHQTAKRAPLSPAIRSTLSTASESSQLSAYSSDGGSGCDTDSDRGEASGWRPAQRHTGQQQRKHNQQQQQQQQHRQPRSAAPQHFTFSVDDIDKALTEEELDEWFSTDEHETAAQRQQQAAERDDDDNDDDEDGEQAEQCRSVTRYTHVAVRSPLFVPAFTASPPSSSSSSCSSASNSSRPRLCIDTVLADQGADGSSESTISILSVVGLCESAAAAPAARRMKAPSLPTTFTFSRSDLRKSADTASEELQVGHWSTFPRPSVPVCDVRALRGRVREKRDEWHSQAARQQLALDQLDRVEEKRESVRKPAAARRLFVDEASAGAVRARQSVVMWKRDSHSAQVAPLPQPLPAPVPSPPNAMRGAPAAAPPQQQPTQQHRRAATAYSQAARGPQAAPRRTHYQYESAALFHLHAAQQQQQRQQMIHAAYVHSSAGRSQAHASHTQPSHSYSHLHSQHQPPAHALLHHQPSSARSDPSSLVGSPLYSQASYGCPTPIYGQPHSTLASYHHVSAAAPASDLFSPRSAHKHNQWRTGSYQQPMHASYAAVQQQQQQQAQYQPQPRHSNPQYDMRQQQQQQAQYGSDYYGHHYSHYTHDALHAVKSVGPPYAAHSHAGLSHEVWLTLQHPSGTSQQRQQHHQQPAAAAACLPLALERCVSAMLLPVSHGSSHSPSSTSSQSQQAPRRPAACQQQPYCDWPSSVSLPAAAHHARGTSAPLSLPHRC